MFLSALIPLQLTDKAYSIVGVGERLRKLSGADVLFSHALVVPDAPVVVVFSTSRLPRHQRHLVGELAGL